MLKKIVITLCIVMVIAFNAAGCGQTKDSEAVKDQQVQESSGNENELTKESQDSQTGEKPADNADETLGNSLDVISTEVDALILVDRLNVRESADEDSIVLGTALKNQAYEIIESKSDKQGRLWYKVAGNYGDGWIASWFCEEITGEHPMHPHYYKEYKDITGSIEESIKDNAMKFEPFQVENGYSFKGIHEHMTRGEMVEILGWPEFAEVKEYDSQTDSFQIFDISVYFLEDCVIKAYMKEGFETTIYRIEVIPSGSKAGWLSVSGDVLNIRTEPKLGSKVVGQTLEHTIHRYFNSVTVEEENRTWHLINDSDIVGWVAGDYVETFEEDELTFYKQQELMSNAIRGVEKNGFYSTYVGVNTEAFVFPFDSDENGEVEMFKVVPHLGEDSAGYKIIESIEIQLEGMSLEREHIGTFEYGAGISGVGFIDLYEDDGQVEFYIVCGSLSDRQVNFVYSVNDHGFKELFMSGGQVMGLSGDGELYYWGGNIYEPREGEFTRDLVLMYYDIEGHEMVDADYSIGKTITAVNISVVYPTKEEVIDGAPVQFEYIRENAETKGYEIVEIGETFTVLENYGGRTKIRTNSGNEGWIGGFHMVWD